MRGAPLLLSLLLLPSAGAATPREGDRVAVGAPEVGAFEWYAPIFQDTRCDRVIVETAPPLDTFPAGAPRVVWLWAQSGLVFSGSARAPVWLPEPREGWTPAYNIASPAFVVEELTRACACDWVCRGYVYLRGTGAVFVCERSGHTWCTDWRPPPELVAPPV